MGDHRRGRPVILYPTAAEQNVIHAARASREQCACGKVHADGDAVTPAVIARMRAFLASHPDRQFAVDDEAGIIALITACDPAAPGPPEVHAWAGDLTALLDHLGAPAAESLS